MIAERSITRQLGLKATAIDVGGTIRVAVTLGEETVLDYLPRTYSFDVALQDAEERIAKIFRTLLVGAINEDDVVRGGSK